MSHYSDFISQLYWHLPVKLTALAQTITDPNVMDQMQKAWSHFIQTGQVWALLIGVIIGYMIRNLTSYG
ncbi:hypothetical protein CDG77_30420 [Nostoc sp. 'Peltigera membranacea cyanobiont' 213]|uniref:hypothetical protein n=1 Tax=unclassified Nostoc TaxID=2593658 RepID=UPI000B9506AE|nr:MULTISPECIES: hypothetical protein [unclassified Nostoc]AVH62615.1 hypothetical protein NPM_0754 [Nostoc sp. 'Peltigera membranacea cyanobiont' N6]OYD87240.1 hypothetical protein CDG77_30420 [Nostoc sp. 'Peltigera membranacea cyanobiont' 213]